MSVFGNFRVRSRQRDRSTDEDRFESLLQAVRKLQGDATNEMTGLTKRYERTSSDAAFALVEEENEGSGDADRIGELTETIMNYEERLKYLERQIAYFAQLERDISVAAESIMHPVSGDSASNDR